MLISVATNGRRPGSTVPEQFEDSTHLVIVETDDNSIVTVYGRRDGECMYFAKKTIEHDCEAIVCGNMQKPAFEEIAANNVTRYFGAGLALLEAAHAAEDNLLPFITEYEGGPGCGGASERSCESHEHAESEE